MTTMIAGWMGVAGLGLVLVGCGAVTATNGPATVILTSTPHQVCVDRAPLLMPLFGGRVRGCLLREAGHVTLVCGPNDVECLAHELRHAVDPAWSHGPDE